MTATLIPEPPLGDGQTLRLTSADLVATIAGGIYGSCVMCRTTCYRWWDLSRCGLAPVMGADGTLTDQVCLHDACTGSLIGYWVSMVTGEPAGDEPTDGGRGGVPGERGDSADRFAGEAERDALMGGMYG